MTKKKRRVDIVTVEVRSLEEGTAAPTFEEVMNFMDKQEVRCPEKIVEFKVINTKQKDYLLGFVETTQDKDIPPIKNKSTKAFSQVNIDVKKEGLAYANIYLYEPAHQLLIYEINRDGCFLAKYKELVETRWMEEHGGQKIELYFTAVLRKKEYERMLQMNAYHRIVLEVTEPTLLLQGLEQKENSLENNLLRTQLRAASKNRVNQMKIEWKSMGVRTDARGIERKHVTKLIGLIHRLCSNGFRNQIKEMAVTGYTLDPEENRPRQRAINLLADTFDESFSIDEIQIQSSLQQGERVDGITRLYQRVLPEIKEILTQD